MSIEAMKLALEALEDVIMQVKYYEQGTTAIDVLRQAIEQAQKQQEPVAMKFKIYKPTVPDPVRQGINNALLPWVYDQDRSSGFDASMWVTPVATLPPQHQPLTDERILEILGIYLDEDDDIEDWRSEINEARAIEAAHGIKE